MRQTIKEKSFTLLEMLIVIGIIAVIVSLAAVSYSNAQKKSRDARRKNDLKSFQSSMEQYYSVCGFLYPTRTGGVNVIPGSIICNSPLVIIMTKTPVDPKTITPYLMPDGDADTYQACADMETDGTQFCVSNQQ